MPLSGGGKLSHLWAGLFWVPPKPQRVHHAEPETQEEDCEDTEEQHSPGNGAGYRPVGQRCWVQTSVYLLTLSGEQP